MGSVDEIRLFHVIGPKKMLGCRAACFKALETPGWCSANQWIDLGQEGNCLVQDFPTNVLRPSPDITMHQLLENKNTFDIVLAAVVESKSLEGEELQILDLSRTGLSELNRYMLDRLL